MKNSFFEIKRTINILFYIKKNMQLATNVDDILEIQKQVYKDLLLETRETIQSILDYKMSYILYDDLKPIGYILVHPWYRLDVPPNLDVPIPSNIIINSTLFIHDLCILQAYQRQKKSKLLLQHVLDSDMSISLVSVCDSVNFWKKYGFQIGEPIITYPDKTATLMYKLKI